MTVRLGTRFADRSEDQVMTLAGGGAEMAAGALRVGVDLVLIPRMAELAEQGGFLARVFQQTELADTRPKHLAGLLAAKEACFKALGMPAHWHEVEVVSDPHGRPVLRLGASLRPPGLACLDLSIAHEGAFAMAVVVALLREADDDQR